MKKKFYVIGHRGACAYAPENTVPSFDKALDLGVDGLETDIRRTRDGVLVLFHDNILDNKSDLTGRVQDYSYAELKKADFGGWFSKEYKGAGILRLDEFLCRYGGRVHLNLEIKDVNIEQQLLDEIKAANLETEDFMITSFNLNSLKQIKKMDQAIPTGYLAADCKKETVHICLENKMEAICPRAAALNAEDVEYAHEKGLFVRAWGVADEDLMKKAYDAGADGMTIDFPDKLIEYIKRQKILKKEGMA
jgi:glycerophosphoryl diester phosphodiesterase